MPRSKRESASAEEREARDRRAVTVHTPGRKSLYVPRQEMRRLADALFDYASKADDDHALDAYREARLLLTVALKSDHLTKSQKVTGAARQADRLLTQLQERVLGRAQPKTIDAEIVPIQMNQPTQEKEYSNGRAHSE